MTDLSVSKNIPSAELPQLPAAPSETKNERSWGDFAKDAAIFSAKAAAPAMLMYAVGATINHQVHAHPEWLVVNREGAHHTLDTHSSVPTPAAPSDAHPPQGTLHKGSGGLRGNLGPVFTDFPRHAPHAEPKSNHAIPGAAAPKEPALPAPCEDTHGARQAMDLVTTDRHVPKPEATKADYSVAGTERVAAAPFTGPPTPLTYEAQLAENEKVVGFVGASTSAGAALGATIGSAIPVVGTLAGGCLGAVAGAMVGLIGGFFIVNNH